jgi:hypothetical protein
MVLLTSLVNVADAETTRSDERPVLSLVMPRATTENLNFDQLDARAALEHVLHRGDFRGAKKSLAFHAIVPLTAADLADASIDNMACDDLLTHIQQLRADLQAQMSALRERYGDVVHDVSQQT